MKPAARAGESSAEISFLTPAVRAAGVLLHRWLGLIVGLVFVVVGLSGSLLAYAPEVKSALFPVIDGPPPAGWKRERATVLARIHAETYPQATLVRFPAGALATYEIYLADGRMEYRDALNGERVLVREPLGDVLGVADAVHTELLLGHDGELLLGWLGVAMLVLVATGAWLWWPRRSMWRFALRRPKSGALNVQFLWWHKTVGIVSIATLFFVTLTGVGMVFHSAAQVLLTGMLGGAAPAVPRTLESPAESVDWRAVVATLDSTLRDGDAVYFYPQRDADDTLRFRKRMPGELHPNGLSFIAMAPGGELLHAHDATKLDAGMRATQSIYPLHAGKNRSDTWRVIVFLMGLVPLFFFATGIQMWLSHRRQRKTNGAGDRRRS